MSQLSSTLRHPPKPRLTVRVGVTGHRPNKLGGEAAARVQGQLPLVFQAVEDAAARILRENAAYFVEEPPAIRLVCGFAEGVDQMAAAACPAGWQIEALLPFPEEEYLKDFQQSAQGDGRDVTEAFLDSLKKAATVTQLPDPRPHDRSKSYADAGGYLLRQIDVLIAVWDGEPPKPGGTGAIAREAFDGGIPVVWLLTTADRSPRLITGFDLAGNPMAPDADCTDGPLANALLPVFAAPSATALDDTRGSARACLDRFLAERWRKRFFLSAYDLMQRTANCRWPRRVRWAYGEDRKAGDYSDVITAGDMLIVAHLVRIKKEGTAEVDDVRERVTRLVLNEKKTVILKKQFEDAMKSSKTMEEIALKVKSVVQPFYNLNFYAGNVQFAGNDPKLVGFICGMKPNQISKPVESHDGVHVFLLESISKPETPKELDSRKKALYDQKKQQAYNSVLEALKKAADVKDERYKFY